MKNELTCLRFSKGQNNNFQRNNTCPYNNNFGQNYNRNFNRNNNNNNAGNNGEGNNFNPLDHKNGFQRQNQQWNTRPNNGSIPVDNNNNNVQYADINQYDDSQNVPNNDGSYYNGNQEVYQNSQVNKNAPPIQFNAMLLESYYSTQNVQVE